VGREANGTIIADPTLFPHGIKALVDYIHSKGLKFGICACCAACCTLAVCLLVPDVYRLHVFLFGLVLRALYLVLFLHNRVRCTLYCTFNFGLVSQPSRVAWNGISLSVLVVRLRGDACVLTAAA